MIEGYVILANDRIWSGKLMYLAEKLGSSAYFYLTKDKNKACLFDTMREAEEFIEEEELHPCRKFKIVKF